MAERSAQPNIKDCRRLLEKSRCQVFSTALLLFNGIDLLLLASLLLFTLLLFSFTHATTIFLLYDLTLRILVLIIRSTLLLQFR